MLARAPAPQAQDDDLSLALPRSFWKEFDKNYFGKKPTVIKQPFARGFPTSDEVFDALVAGAQHLLREQSLAIMKAFRFYLEHEDGPDGVAYHSMLFPLTRRHLPLPEDENFEAYYHRLDKWLGGKRFGIVLNSGQSYNWRHWLQLRSFLQGMYEGLGMPLFGADPAILFGNYRFTPFGIHKDDLAVFNFIVHGKKIISLWPFETLGSRPEMPKDPELPLRTASVHLLDKADEDAMLAKASFIEGDPGDILTWPVTYWHRAEPTEGLSICISLGVAYRPPDFFGVGPQPQWPGILTPKELPSRDGWQLPDSVRVPLRHASKANTVVASERALTEHWVRYATNGAMSGPPPEDTNTVLSAQDWIQGGGGYHSLVAVPLPDGDVLVSANGRSTGLSVSPAVRRRIEWLVSTLNGPKAQHVEALESQFFSRLPARGFTRKAFLGLLNDMVRWRAVRKVAPKKGR
ncbi:hypothetical protein JGU66_26645 [Myxococcaceae bacterium JPH2]|nr:hypothetical protein [Myxococcaceae bacterium JPH2]